MKKRQSAGLPDAMRFRCPYCRQIFASEGRNRCPECGKTVLLPGFFGKSAKAPVEGLARQRRQQSGRAMPGSWIPLGKPGRVVIVMALLFVAGGLLLQRSQSRPPPTEQRNRRLAYENLLTLREAVNRFRHDCGAYPSSREGLASLLLNPDKEGWSGPYILELKPDPWGSSFLYRRAPGLSLVYSPGPDRIPDSADDIRIEWTDQGPHETEPDIFPARIRAAGKQTGKGE